jgi:hypothetical protein
MKRVLTIIRAGAVLLLSAFQAFQLSVWVVVIIISAGDDLKYASVWKDQSAIALADGYTDYQGETNLTDYGVIVFSYAYRSGSRPLIELRDRIVKEYPCYTVIRESATRLAVRCGNVLEKKPPPGRYNGVYEFDFFLDEARGRVFVLRMSQVPPSEERYRELVGALDRSLRRYEPRGRSS